jgi:hypothetical protein
MAVWDVLRFDVDSITVTDGLNAVCCQVDGGKIVWNSESKKLPKYIKERIIMMAWQRTYLYCTKNTCSHHKYKASKGVTNVCGLKNVNVHIASGEVQTVMGFWQGPQTVSCNKFRHEIEDM